MQIEKIERYVVDGKEFRTPEKAMEHVSDLIGALIDRTVTNNGMFGPAHRLAIHGFLLANRKELVRLLSVEPYKDDE
jgi:hypothetical protein